MPQDTIIAGWILGVAFAIFVGLLIKFRAKIEWRVPGNRGPRRSAPVGPAVNTDGTPMIGSVDIHGRPFGSTGL